MSAAPLAALQIPPFAPPRWARSGHVQTALVPYVPTARAPRGERVSVPIADGALAARLHFAGEAPARACVLVLHGIAGSADEPFVLRTARGAVRRGMDALRLHLRGAGESLTPGPAPLFHAGLTDDVRSALEYLCARYEAVHAVGFSLGGQLLLRALGEWGPGAPAAVRSATAISPPIDLAACAHFAELPAAALYRAFIVRALKARYHAARPAMGPRFTAALVHSVRTIREFDAAVVAPFFGFRDASDYYRQVSAHTVIDAIRAPTLLLHAADDPLVPVEPVRALAAQRLPRLRVVETAHGGHVGWLGRESVAGDRTRFWAEERALALAVAYTPGAAAPP